MKKKQTKYYILFTPYDATERQHWLRNSDGEILSFSNTSEATKYIESVQDEKGGVYYVTSPSIATITEIQKTK